MKKILIVDDEKISLMMTEHILSTEYQTVCATSGDEAISLYHDEQPDMVLSDLHMPGIDGYDLQLFLQAQFHEKIPFMFMTADPDEELEKRGFENGAMDFIRKPFRADVLIHRIENILQTVEQINGLKKAAVTDPMTGLLNEASSQHQIGLACQNSIGALIITSLDNFKKFNEQYGQDVGDRVLIRYSEILQSAIRTTDLAGRLEGDVFIAFCKNVSIEEVIARKTAYINEQLLASAANYAGEDLSVALGVSIGCVFVPEEGTDYAQLYEKAESALFEAKEDGQHGYSIYHRESGEDEEESQSTSDLINTAKIFGEQEVLPGAFVLQNDDFRIIYQFLSRYITNYKKEIWMLQFTIHSQIPDDPALAETAGNFLSVLKSSLRQSDVITQIGENQFLVFILETTKKKIEFVTTRIMDNWNISELGRPDHSISFEKDILQ